MANAKYFALTHTQTGKQHLVRTSKPAIALAAVAAADGRPVTADQDAITAHFNAGGTLHAKSRTEGAGKHFLMPVGDGTALIRAKNDADAVSLIAGDEYECKVADSDTLVQLLEKGIRPIVIDVEPKAKKAAPITADAVG